MDQGEGEKMSEKDFEETVLRRLANLESHIINMIHPLQQIQSIFRDSSVKDEFVTTINAAIQRMNRPLTVDDRDLRKLAQELRDTVKDFIETASNVDVGKTLGEIKFIGKKLQEIEVHLNNPPNKEEKKKIELVFKCDGYELVKRPVNYDPLEKIELPEENLKQLLETLTTNEKLCVIHRLGLLGEEPQAFAKIAKIIGVSGGRVGQIYQKALRKLRHPKRIKLAEKTRCPILELAIFGEKIN